MRNRLLLPLLVCLLGAGCAHNYTLWRPTLDDQQTKYQDLKAHVQQSVELHSDDQSKEWQVEKDFAAIEGQQLEDPQTLDHFYRRLDVKATRPGADVTATQRAAVATAKLNAVKLRSLFQQEREAIVLAERNPHIGLALSGGGVRSASFAQGVLIGLHELGVLDDVGYLSTVSGGGFTGGWYMTHRFEKVDDGDKTDGDDKTDDGEKPQGVDILLAPGSNDLHHLAQYGQYLNSKHVSKRWGPEVLFVFKAFVGHIQNLFGNALFDLDVNTLGVRNRYRNGIQRAFLYEQALTERTSSWDRKSMNKLLPSPDHLRPFWIVNCHLVLSDAPGLRNRSGDHFEITPRWSGARSVGYVETDDHVWMTPLRAMAASGAAVDSKSLQQSYFTSQLIKAFNLDLGYYIDSWSPKFGEEECGWTVFWRNIWWVCTSPVGLFNIFELWDCTPTYHNETVLARKYYITDGAHFENTGIYALVRRGCRLIIASDGTSDPRSSSDWETMTNEQRALAFNDMRRLEELIYADFGAHVNVQWERFSPELTPPKNSCPSSPAARFGDGPDHTVLVATIDNLPVGSGAEDDRVVIAFVKAAYSIDERLRHDYGFMDEYKATSGDFPNESTIDQFFSERQVLSYRALGHQAVVNNRRWIKDAVDEVIARDGELAVPSF